MEVTYTAITKDGRREMASIQAPNLPAAGHMLKERGLLPTQLGERGAKSSTASFLNMVMMVSLADKIGFIENLSVMLKAGISISRCLQILVKQTQNTKFKSILSD